MYVCGNVGIASLILHLGITWKWVLNIKPRTPFPEVNPTRYAIEKDGGWAQEPVWQFRRKEKSSAHAEIRTFDRQVCGLVAMPTTLRWLDIILLSA